MTDQKLAAHASRNPEQTQEAILAAAEQLFAERGYEATRIADIAAAAGVAQGTPGYFFGNKDRLYRAVLQRAFSAREAFLTDRFLRALAILAPPADDPSVPPDDQTVRAALGAAVDGFLDFLDTYPTFVKLVEHEALRGGDRSLDLPTDSVAVNFLITELFARACGRRAGARQAKFLFITFAALTFFPRAHRTTLLAGLGVDDGTGEFREARRNHVIDLLAAAVAIIREQNLGEP